MKTRRAQAHLEALTIELDKWINLPPHTVTCETDFERVLEIWGVWMKPTPEPLAMLLGDFVCCLRSALDQLAWGLAHLDTKRIFTDREQRNIAFPVAGLDDSNYRNRLGLFPATVTADIDSFQPYHRGDAYRDDPLWQLHELWTLDKHRAIPIAASSLNVRFPMWGWENFLRHFEYGFEVQFPLLRAWLSPVDLKPDISMEVTFGEYGSTFEIGFERLKEINDFVGNDVIPRFAGFFA